MADAVPTAEASPRQMLQLITTGLWITKGLYIAAKLGVADLLATGPQTSEELARATGTHGPSLYRVLRALASLGVFAEDAQGRFGLTPLAVTLQSGPGSLRALAQMWGEPWHWQAWSGLLHSVRTGEAGWKHALGADIFDYLAQQPEAAAVFHDAMSSLSGVEAAAVAAAYDFSEVKKLLDVGGGQGLLVATLLRAYPHLQGIVFDQPSIIAGAPTVLREAGVAARAKSLAGDFFQAIPSEGDALILKHIIHDWSDARALQILKNCRRAVPPHGKLLVVQEVLPPGNQPSMGKLFDVEMLLIGGQERTEAEFRALYEAAGFALTRIIPTQAGLHVIEGKPI
jgi:hypothetical protein